MGSKKLVFCCILGIVLGFAAPFFLPVLRSTSLSVGMVAGLGIGYLLDMMDEKKTKDAGTAVISQKADAANKLLEQARAEIGERPSLYDDHMAEDDKEEIDRSERSELSAEEQAEKINEAEALLRKARENIGDLPDDGSDAKEPNLPAAAEHLENTDQETDEQTEKLNEAEELLRKARERIGNRE
ncbi:MAG: hypothetical protein IJI14_11665 [Anaerolineaceae bacterium]|nr:hypothetical protein [Anaerolineaceae bacterium]